MKFLLPIVILLSSCSTFNEPTFIHQQWDLPMPVYVGWEDLDHQERAMEYALEMFPCDMLRRVPLNETPTIKVLIADYRDRGVCGGSSVAKLDGEATYLCKDDEAGTSWAEVWLDHDSLSQWDETKAMLVMGHGLGHAVGLGDKRRVPLGSPGIVPLMSKNSPQHYRRLIDLGLPLPILIRPSKNALEERYCR